MSKLVDDVFNLVKMNDACDALYNSYQIEVFDGLVTYFTRHNDDLCKLEEKSIVEENGKVLFKLIDENYENLSFSSNMDIFCLITGGCFSSDYVNAMRLYDTREVIRLIECDKMSCDEYKSQYLDVLKCIGRDYSFMSDVKEDQIDLIYTISFLSFKITINNTYSCSESVFNTDYDLIIDFSTYLTKEDDVANEVCDMLDFYIHPTLSEDELNKINREMRVYFEEFFLTTAVISIEIGMKISISNKLPTTEKFKHISTVFVNDTSILSLIIHTNDSSDQSYTIVHN